MDHKELRVVLMDHFRRFLASQKAKIDAEGPLSPAERQPLEGIIGFSEMEVAYGPLSEEGTAATAKGFVDRYNLDLDPTSPLFETFKRMISEAHGGYAKAVLDYSDRAEKFDFIERTSSAPSPTATNRPAMKLSELVNQFWKYAKLENRWTEKTEGEKQEHIDLLYERFGKDTDAAGFGREQAHLMRDTLRDYPVNRHKLKETRGKTLDEALSVEGMKKLHVLTINKYLQTYNGLFNWAVQNGHCSANPFDGLVLRADKANRDDPRLPFSDEQLSVICDALLSSTAKHAEHHKWGALIGIHSGARLNEIAQLHIDDVREIDGLWCFDINAKQGTLKKLKNAASKRIVPIHPRLIEHGFIAYFERMKTEGRERLFPKFTHSKSDGYGRNLGRWVNEAFLPNLDLKAKQLTFHSFRHTMVRKLIAADVSQAHIMAIVGHEPGTTTLSTYNRLGFPPAQLLAALKKAL